MKRTVAYPSTFLDKNNEVRSDLSQKEVQDISKYGDIEMTVDEVAARKTEIDFHTIESVRHAIIEKIICLEKTQTPRRIRESVLGLDNGWLKETEEQIKELRSQLN